MTYFIKGKYNLRLTDPVAYGCVIGKYQSFEMIVDCEPLKIYDYIRERFSLRNSEVYNIDIDNIIKLS